MNKIASKSLDNKTPIQRVELAINQAQNPVITTNFRPFESAILHLVTSVKNDIPVIWCDTGYNTKATYAHARGLIERLGLNIKLYSPKQTASYRKVFLGEPEIDTPEHTLFTEQVKLEPFRRALSELQPDVWFTNLRQGQTAHRDALGAVSYSSDNIMKVSPFFEYSDEQLQLYLTQHNLPNELDYYDPTKVLSHRECGLHLT